MGKLIDDSGWYGNVTNGTVVSMAVNVSDKNGASVNWTGSPSAVVYKDDNTAEITSGITVATPGNAGQYRAQVDTSGGDYVDGSDYKLCIVGAVVDSETITQVIGSFSINNRS